MIELGLRDAIRDSAEPRGGARDVGLWRFISAKHIRHLTFALSSPKRRPVAPKVRRK